MNNPHYLVYGKQAIKPIDLKLEMPTTTLVDPGQDQSTDCNILIEARKLARELIKASQLKNKEVYDKNRSESNFKTGDLVLYKKPIISGDRKFNIPWSGPFIVIKKLNDINYLIGCQDNKEQFIVHCTQIKRYDSRRVDAEKGETDCLQKNPSS